MRYLFTVLVLSACARGYIEPSPRATDLHTRVVYRVWANPTFDEWRNSGWYKPEQDIVTPARVYISSNEWACPIETPLVNEPRHAEYFRCPTSWRPFRP